MEAVTIVLIFEVDETFILKMDSVAMPEFHFQNFRNDKKYLSI